MTGVCHCFVHYISITIIIKRTAVAAIPQLSIVLFLSDEEKYIPSFNDFIELLFFVLSKTKSRFSYLSVNGAIEYGWSR